MPDETGAGYWRNLFQATGAVPVVVCTSLCFSLFALVSVCLALYGFPIRSMAGEQVTMSSLSDVFDLGPCSR